MRNLCYKTNLQSQPTPAPTNISVQTRTKHYTNFPNSTNPTTRITNATTQSISPPAAIRYHITTITTIPNSMPIYLMQNCTWQESCGNGTYESSNDTYSYVNGVRGCDAE